MLQIKREPNPIDKHVGNNMRLRRLELRWSQTKVAKALGISFQQVQKYEAGTNRIGASRLHNMAEILEVPVTFFFESLEKPQNMHPYSEFTPSPEYLSLMQAFIRIRNARIRRCIIALLEELGNAKRID
jgi:transcriptional regulator with XRE-family HTH domain